MSCIYYNELLWGVHPILGACKLIYLTQLFIYITNMLLLDFNMSLVGGFVMK